MNLDHRIAIITDDVVSACILSDVYARPDKYFTVLESPRMQRPDALNEIAKIVNVLNRLRPALVILYRQPVEVYRELKNALPINFLPVDNIDELAKLKFNVDAWKGLLPAHAIEKLHSKYVSEGNRLVLHTGIVDLSYVIAANYAIAYRADLMHIEVGEGAIRDAIDSLNSIDSSSQEIREIDINQLTEKLQSILPRTFFNKEYDEYLIVTDGLPLSLALYPRKVIYANNLMLGQHFFHNVYEYNWGQSERLAPIGLYIQDRSVGTEGEYNSFDKAMLDARGLPKRMTTSNPKLAELEIMTLPYDILYIATHGKQLDSKLNIYRIEFQDGIHELKLNVASGAIGFVFYLESVDGIRREDEGWSEMQSAVWVEFNQRFLMNREELPDPISSENSQVPMRTLVLGYEEGNSPFAVQRIASAQRPIVIANACGSWTDLSGRFTFAGVASYIGTLWAVRDDIAAQFGVTFNEHLLKEPLFEAFNKGVNSLPDDLSKKNYVITGAFENKYDSDIPFTSNGYDEVMNRLKRNLAKTKERLAEYDSNTPEDLVNNTEIDEMLYEQEIERLEDLIK